MRKLLVALAALAAAAVAVPLGFGSSHREAPNISLDPTADNTDTYAFTAKDAPGALTVAANWIPGEVPANGPNFFRFDDRARYYIHIDNTGDGKPDVRYRFKFKTKVRNPDSFLYALPGVSGSTTRSSTSSRRTRSSARRSATRAGKTTSRRRRSPAACPSRRRTSARRRSRTTRRSPTVPSRRLTDGGKVFAGQRDDPFFVDLGATFDGINVRKLTGNKGEGKDDLGGYQHPLDRPAGPGGAGDQATSKAVSARRRRQRGRRRVVDDRAPQARGRPDCDSRKRRARATGSRSRAWATRSSTRSSSRWARRTSSTGRPRTATPRSTASTWSSRSWRRS